MGNSPFSKNYTPRPTESRFGRDARIERMRVEASNLPDNLQVLEKFVSDNVDLLYSDPDTEARISNRIRILRQAGAKARANAEMDRREAYRSAGAWWVDEKNGDIVKKSEVGENVGVVRGLPHLGNAGRGINRPGTNLSEYIQNLSDRIRNTRITCGNWDRVLGPSVTTQHGVTAVILDPPYGEGEMDYRAGGNNNGDVASEVWRWALENGNNPMLRIAVCGYEDGREVPDGWSKLNWKARKGYQADTTNSYRETVWLSPHCVKQTPLFGDDY